MTVVMQKLCLLTYLCHVEAAAPNGSAAVNQGDHGDQSRDKQTRNLHQIKSQNAYSTQFWRGFVAHAPTTSIILADFWWALSNMQLSKSFVVSSKTLYKPLYKLELCIQPLQDVYLQGSF